MARLPRGWEKSETRNDKEEWKATEKPYNVVWWERIERGVYEAKVRSGPDVRQIGQGTVDDKQDARGLCQRYIRDYPKGDIEFPQPKQEYEGETWTLWEDEGWHDSERMQNHIDIVERWANKKGYQFEYVIGSKDDIYDDPSDSDGKYVWYRGLEDKHPRDFLAMNSDYEWVGKSKNP
jgi:hypothetical protein